MPSESAESLQWKSFSLQEFGDPYLVWHDGASFEAINRRCQVDPNGVDRMLRIGLREHDPLAAQAIDLLVAKRALEGDFTQALVDAMRSASGSFRIATAKTLLLQTGSQAWAADFVEVLQDDPFSHVRQDAARALALVEPNPGVVDALAQAVSDPDYLVRYQAANSMLSLSHAGTTVDKSEWLFSRIRSETSPDSWHEAGSKLRERFPTQRT
jgi:hypothetical protein